MKDSSISYFALIACVGLVLAVYASATSLIYVNKTEDTNQIIHSLYNTNISLNSNIDSLKNELVKLSYERKSNTDQLSLLSTWVIAYVTILFGAFAFLGYTNFSKQLDAIKHECDRSIKDELTNNVKMIEDQNKIINSHKKDILEFRDEFKDLKGLVFSNIGNVQFIISHDKNVNDNIVLEYAILGCESMAMANNLRPTPLNLANIIHGLKLALDVLNKPSFKSLAINLLSESHDFKESIKALNEVAKIENEEIKVLCATILVKLNNLYLV